jgi:hypothetical protein
MEPRTLVAQAFSCLSYDGVTSYLSQHPAYVLRKQTDIRGRRGSSTAGEEAADASVPVDNKGTRVALGRERAGPVVEWEDPPLLGNLEVVVAEVVADVTADVVGAADSQVALSRLITMRHGSPF